MHRHARLDEVARSVGLRVGEAEHQIVLDG